VGNDLTESGEIVLIGVERILEQVEAVSGEIKIGGSEHVLVARHGQDDLHNGIRYAAICDTVDYERHGVPPRPQQGGRRPPLREQSYCSRPLSAYRYVLAWQVWPCEECPSKS
jgi:hypothetical protein